MKKSNTKRHLNQFFVSRTLRYFGNILSRQEDPMLSVSPIFPDPPGRICNFSHDGVDYAFIVSRENDTIQRHHLEGTLYEVEELEIIKRNFIPGSVFVDIGANVGNHAVFAAKTLDTAKVIAFEPVTANHALLCMNVALNGVGDKIEIHKVALANNRGRLKIQIRSQLNQGGARLVASMIGETVSVRRGDDFLLGMEEAFIKIDVEGAELLALQGMSGVISRIRPSMFIEVEEANYSRFDRWLKENNYEIVETYMRYDTITNFMIRARV